MKVLIASTATDNSSLAGIHHGYGRGLRELGHDVTSISHAEMAKEDRRGIEYDFFLLRDTFRVDAGVTRRIADRCGAFAMFTHAECLQAERDALFIQMVKPDHVFLDQPLGHTTAFSALDVPMAFLGYGANHACRMSPVKDIDIGFFGNAYPKRQPSIEEYIFPLMESRFNVKIHGRGQPHGPLELDEMFEVMSRTKVVINVCGPGARELGYGGRRILDAMASGAAVVADEFAMCYETYDVTGGVSFAQTDGLGLLALCLLEDESWSLRPKQLVGYRYVHENWMISHVCQQMIDLTQGVK